MTSEVLSRLVCGSSGRSAALSDKRKEDRRQIRLLLAHRLSACVSHPGGSHVLTSTLILRAPSQLH